MPGDWQNRRALRQPAESQGLVWRTQGSGKTFTPPVYLAEQQPDFQDFVIAHELLHLRIPNHGKLFKALMTAQLPGWKKQDVRRRST